MSKCAYTPADFLMDTLPTTDTFPNTPWSVSCRSGNVDLVRVLAEICFPGFSLPDESPDVPVQAKHVFAGFLHACASGDVPTVKYLISRFNIKPGKISSAECNKDFEAACTGAHTSVAMLLLQELFPPDKGNDLPWLQPALDSAFKGAVRTGDTDLVEFLVAHFALPDPCVCAVFAKVFAFIQ